LPTRTEAIAALTAPGQPYALTSETIAGRALKVFVKAPPSLRALYADTASDAEFLVYGPQRLTFAQTRRRAAQLARVLVDRFGVAPGDRVAISMRNYPEWVIGFTAATSIGAIAVAMNAWWQPEEMAYGLNDCGAKVLLADQERLERLARCGPRPGLGVIAVRPTTDHPGAIAFDALLADVGDVPMPEVAVRPEDPAIIFYTSGSTGHPKGVMSSHRAVVSAMLSWELDAQAAALVAGVELPVPAQQPAALLGIPLFHATGSHAVYLMSYRQQRRMVCMHKWDPEEAARLIEQERITTFIAPAAMTGDLVRAGRTTARDLSSLLAVGGGGAPRAPEQVRQIDATFANALPGTGWGMTETNAIGTGIGGEEYLQRPASSGRCSAVMELRIVDDDARVLGANVRGELQVRGTCMFEGYWNRPELNATVFDDGWFRTGDVALFDDEGYLFIVDRIKDLIIRGGENIGCGQVEAALLMHPQVHEAAVYGVPDERLGEEVGATIHCDPALSLDALRGFLEAHLARFEVPRYILKSDAPLARTASGKILKRELREAALAAFANEIGNTQT